MEQLRVQVSLWCKPQVRLFLEILESNFRRVDLPVPDANKSFEDLRDPTNGKVGDTDEIDLLTSKVGPSCHFFFDVNTQAEADLISRSAKDSTMRFLLMPQGGILSDHPSKSLEPFIDIS